MIFLAWSYLLYSVALAEPPSFDPVFNDVHTLTGRQKRLYLGDGVLKRCRTRAAQSAEDLARELSAFNITVRSPREQDKDLLIYLLAYVEALSISPKEALSVVVNDKESPELVRKTGNTLTFSRNAAKDVFTVKLVEALKTNGSATQVTVDFRNTLFEQLSEQIADAEVVKSILKKQFGIQIDEWASYKNSEYAREMTHQESVALLKQFLDLPASLTNALKLKTVIRMRPGIGDEDVDADYSASEQTIRLYDGAFAKGRVLGEGSMLHELGHALWQNLPSDIRERFIDVSWEKNSSGKYILKEGKPYFVSPYARKSPEEDFAETFSAFVNQPEWLKTKALQKHQVLTEGFRNYLLDDSQYSSSGSGPGKLKVDSEHPDTAPPAFGPGRMSEYVKLRRDVVREAKEVEFEVTMSDLHDDISGVMDGSVHISDGKDTSVCMLFNGEHCVDAKRGLYKVKGKFPLNQFPKDTVLNLTTVIVRDHAGNEEYYPGTGIKTHVDGTQQAAHRPAKHPLESRLSEIKIEPLPPEDGKEPSFKITLPISGATDYSSLAIEWAVPSRPSYASYHYFTQEPLDPDFIDSGADEVSFLIHFPKYLQPETLSMSSILLSYPKTDALHNKIYQIGVPKSLENTRVEVFPSDPMASRVDIFAGETQATMGKDGALRVKVAVGGLDPTQDEHVKAWLRLQSPSGKTVLFLVSAELVKDSAGKTWAILDCKFPINPEGGEYLIKDITLWSRREIGEGVTGARGTTDNGGNESFYSKEVKFLERGIRRSFDVSE